MGVAGFGCPTCRAALDANVTDTPAQTCKYCGTVVKNPFFNEDASSDRIAMPVININLGQGMVSGQPAQVTGVPSHVQKPAESYRNWTVAFLLCLFLGIFGAHRFYTGHMLVGAIQFCTLGMAGFWTLIDLILIATGVYRDSDGLPLSGRRLSNRAGIIVVGVLLLCIVSCVALVIIGENASKIDPWIILESDLGSIFANHRMNLAAPISHARFYLGLLITALST